MAKRYLNKDTERGSYFDDVKLQMDAKLWAEEYDKCNPPKKVDIMQTYVIELFEREVRAPPASLPLANGLPGLARVLSRALYRGHLRQVQQQLGLRRRRHCMIAIISKKINTNRRRRRKRRGRNKREDQAPLKRTNFPTNTANE